MQTQLRASTPTHPLLHTILGYCDKNRLPVSMFGRAAAGDPRFVSDLRAGRQPRETTIARIVAFIEQGSAA